MVKRKNRSIGKGNKTNGKETLKLCTLSGTSEIGRNCNFVQYKNEIVLVDAGYSFPGSEMYGIDYLIPNISYLKKNKKKIKAILITHGHLDHIGALKWLLPDLGYPPVYAGGFAKSLIDLKMKEYHLNKKVKVIEVRRGEKVRIGEYYKATFIGINHSIPDAFSIFLESPVGNLFFSGDFKFDLQPANEPQSDYRMLNSLKRRVDLALIESTNATVPGKAPSETMISKNLEDVISHWNGRVIVSAFSSLITRLYSLIEIAKKTNRKVYLGGKSLEQAIDIARKNGYINVEDDVFINNKQINKYPDDRILILCTGSQGERFAVLNRISLNEHPTIKIKKGDLVMMSSSEIPENITTIERMTDRLIALGAELMKDNVNFKIHSTGHGNQGDIHSMIDMIRPKSVMPIHGSLTFRYFNKQNLVKWGMNPNNVFLTEDGQMWEYNGLYWKRDRHIESKPILIDGLGVGDVGDMVLKDRKQLSEYGMFIVILNLSHNTHKILGKPKFMSRGFIYFKHSKNLLHEIGNCITDTHRAWMNLDKQDNKELEEMIEKSLAKLIHKKTEREPIIMVNII
ncbi:ribonuclease J [bacterium]|nr:ribonuclease J [bacterium]